MPWGGDSFDQFSQKDNAKVKKNLILEEITKDETISLQLFLSFIVIKVLEAKGLIKKIYEDF